MAPNIATIRAAASGLIVSVADEVNADMIVMSTVALTGPASALLGSVTDALCNVFHDHPATEEPDPHQDIGDDA